VIVDVDPLLRGIVSGMDFRQVQVEALSIGGSTTTA